MQISSRRGGQPDIKVVNMGGCSLEGTVNEKVKSQGRIENDYLI